ncbi:MAG: tRNA (adenosine(37)-N6)-dimethylallyltransferase MiaA [Polyangiales bacterium]
MPRPILLPAGHEPVQPDELLVIAGETSSGKTALALKLSREVGGEIVGADSVQVYRGFDIGSGKPTAEELGEVTHHLIDVVDPDAPFDAGRFIELADRAIAEIRARDRVPIVCGGSFLWIKALLYGLASAPSAPIEVRAALQVEVARAGSPSAHARLAKIDPESAARLHPNDAVRIVRALEVHATTGKPLSRWQSEHGFRDRRYHARVIAIATPREEIDARIAHRVSAMISRGLIEEVQQLLSRGYHEARAMQSVGYAQVKEFIDGGLERGALEEKISRATRIFARRQRTWLKGGDVAWIDAASANQG